MKIDQVAGLGRRDYEAVAVMPYAERRPSAVGLGGRMSWIELKHQGKSLGRFDLPDHIRSERAIYRLVYAIRQGGNGVVFDAVEMENMHESKNRLAIKLLKEQDDSKVDRFENEIRVIRACNHSNIAQYKDDGVVQLGEHEIRWLALSLGRQNLRRHVDEVGAIAPDDLKRVTVQICDAVEHLHEAGFIHRDIKPDNFVWASDETHAIHMIDFGIAKRVDEDVSARPLDNFTQTLEFVGPVFFSSPELIAYASDKNTVVDHRSDIFQLGKLFWYLGTGTISAGIPSKSLCPLRGRWRDLVLELVQDDPRDRPQSVNDVRNWLTSL